VGNPSKKRALAYHSLNIRRMRYYCVAYFLSLALLIYLVDRRVLHHFPYYVQGVPHWNKYLHFFGYGVLSFCFNLAIDCKRIVIKNHRFLLGSLIIGVLAELEECSQLYIPGRTFGWPDLTANFLGVFLLGQMAWYIHERRTFLFNIPLIKISFDKAWVAQTSSFWVKHLRAFCLAVKERLVMWNHKPLVFKSIFPASKKRTLP